MAENRVFQQGEGNLTFVALVRGRFPGKVHTINFSEESHEFHSRLLQASLNFHRLHIFSFYLSIASLEGDINASEPQSV